MKPEDLKTKCARVMLESGPDVMVKLTVPKPDDMKDGATVIALGLTRNGGPMATVKGSSVIGKVSMLTVWVKAAELLKALDK